MRTTFLLLIALTLIAACQSENKPKANFQLPFRKDSLVGNWMVISLKPITNDKQYEAAIDTAVNQLKEEIVLTAYSFQPGGTVLIDEGNAEINNGRWQFNNKSKKMLIQYKDADTTIPTPLFAVMRYRNDSLTLENNNPIAIDDISSGKKVTLHMQYILKRLRDNDSVPNLFDPALNKWRRKPLQVEDDAAIKLRLKQVLHYYAAYFANIKGNKIPIFNLQKILCPIKFYSGGIGMKKFKEADNWTTVFYDKQDARKAHTMLDQAFDGINGYPDKGGDYVAEYIIALKIVADLL